jgi:hypothetical protein
MECWSIGTMEKWVESRAYLKRILAPIFHPSIIPVS